MPERATSASFSSDPGGRSRTEAASETGQGPDLPGLPTGFTRRRMAFLGAGLLAGWILITFARQVGEASAATSRLEGLGASNAQLAGEVAALEREYQLIQGDAWV